MTLVFSGLKDLMPLISSLSMEHMVARLAL